MQSQKRDDQGDGHYGARGSGAADGVYDNAFSLQHCRCDMMPRGILRGELPRLAIWNALKLL